MLISHREHFLFTDGSSLGNPGHGGWGVVVVSKVKRQKSKTGSTYDVRVIEIGGGEKYTTNNRMELTALIEGLRRIAAIQGRTLGKGEDLRVDPQGLPLEGSMLGDLTIYVDSSYVHKGSTEWSRGWVKSNWQTKSKKDVENRDLWEVLLPLLEERKKFGRIIWKHIPGHSGIAGNVRADAIATGFAKGSDVELFDGDLGNYGIDILDTTVDKRVAEKRSASRARSRAKAYAYLSIVNGKAMRHATWTDCERRVNKVAGAKYKKALSSEDESAILKSWGVHL